MYFVPIIKQVQRKEKIKTNIIELFPPKEQSLLLKVSNFEIVSKGTQLIIILWNG